MASSITTGFRMGVVSPMALSQPAFAPGRAAADFLPAFAARAQSPSYRRLASLEKNIRTRRSAWAPSRRLFGGRRGTWEPPMRFQRRNAEFRLQDIPHRGNVSRMALRLNLRS